MGAVTEGLVREREKLETWPHLMGLGSAQWLGTRLLTSLPLTCDVRR